MALRAGYDWFYPYYRDPGPALTLEDPRKRLSQAVGVLWDRASGGRQMLSHRNSLDLHIVTGSSPTGTQFVQAAGCAHASQLREPGH